MIPLENLVTINQTTAPQVISHYNLFRSAEIDGSAAPGFSSGQAIDAMAELSQKVLPQGFAFQWTGLSLEELSSGSTTLILFGLGTLVVYLTLSAQYESFVLPFIVLLAVPMALLGSIEGAVVARTAERRLLPDRTGDAGGTLQQERHSDRRICRTVAAYAGCRCLKPRSRRQESGCVRF